MTVKLDNLINYLDNIFEEYTAVKDISWNGLQVEGKKNIENIVCTTDSGIEVFEKAITKYNADFIFVHHGLFWKYSNPSINFAMKKRVELLLKNDVSLYAMHLPLDMHKKFGNNVGLLDLMKIEKKEEFQLNGKFITYAGYFDKEENIDSVCNIVNKIFGKECKVLKNKEKIKKVLIISGAMGYSDIETAVRENIDLVITGEEIDIYQYAKDSGISVMFYGHHATETIGPKLIANHLSRVFDVNSIFVDFPTNL